MTMIALVEKQEPKFALGDVVYLKSGGPKMTVCDIQNEPGCVVVVWFVNDLVQCEVFGEALLQK